jgi:hypothetical protein
MRRWLYLAAVIVSAAASATLLVLQFVSFAPSVGVQRLSAFAHLFGSALPLPLAQFVPDALTVGLGGVTFLLSIRRLLRMATARALVTPESLATWPFRLLVLALVSFVLCVGSIAIAHLTGRSELVPIGFILGWPAAMLLAPIVTCVELTEAWRHRRRPTP